MEKRIIGILFTIMVFSLLFTCNLGQNEKTGTLVLSFPMVQNKTLLPAISMEPVSYDINGTGPNGATFSITTNQSIVEITGLDFGDWTITAGAKNVNGTIIGHGETICTVHVGETTTVNITVTPLDGTGTIDLAVNWTAGDTEYPSIVSEIALAAGTPVDLDFTIIGGNLGTVVNNTIPTGFHTLIVKLMDGNAAKITPILTMGAVEVVWIVKDETTYGTFDFTQINQPGGNIQVNITPEMNDPIVVTLSGQQKEIIVGSSLTVTASVPEDVMNVTYVWYINGESQATGESYDVSGLALGVYRLDVTAFTTDGKRAGSEMFSFRVVQEYTQAYLPKTGQTSSYSTGDDGDLQKGVTWPSPRFTNNLDGTITDNLTGLMWERVPSATSRNWQEALDYCNDLALAGHTDWSLPNINELCSLVNWGVSSPASWLNSQDFNNVQSEGYWSSTTCAFDTSWTRYIRMSVGQVYVTSKENLFYIMAVRGGQSGESFLALPETGQKISYTAGDDGYYQKGIGWPSPRFTDNGDMTITDNLTGLIWELSPSGTQSTWQAALDYCNNLTLAGYTDWRLPNLNELLSLLHYGESNQSSWLNSQGFSIQTHGYWSSNTYAYYTSGGLVIEMIWGNGSGYNKASNDCVIAVRGGQ